MRTVRGFTIVELVVVMVIMAVLLTLAMVNISNSQVSVRDKKRAAAAEAIARGLEARYNQGNPRISSTPGNYTTAGGYPGVFEFQHMLGIDMGANNFVPAVITGGYIDDVLPGVSLDIRTAPGKPAGQALRLYCTPPSCSAAPENATHLAAQLTIDTYLYEPLTSNSTQCNNEKCTRFNLYYRTESNAQLQKIMSKHQ